MAKKQQIILTHGTNAPENVVIAKGEVLVQHAVKAEDAALHTVLDNGATLVSFPSKEWVNAEIAKVNADGINGKIDAIDGRVKTIEDDYLTSTDKAELEGKVTAEATARDNADKAIDAKFGDGIDATNTVAKAIKTEENARIERDNALQAAIDLKVAQSDYNTKVGEIDADIAGLQDVLDGYNEKGAVQSAIDLKVAQSEYNAKVTEFGNKISALETSVSTLDDTYVNNDELASAKTELEGKITKAKTTLTAAPDVTAGVKVTKTADDPNNYQIEAVGLATQSALDATDATITTIQGEDKDKSMRAVAKEEVDSFKDLLYGDGTADVIDTLKDVINWIDSDTTGATKIVSDIENLQKTTAGFSKDATIKATTDAIDGRVTAIANDYLKAADKTELEGKVTAEEDARKDADAKIEEKIGGSYSKESTVAMAIATEIDDRKEAVKGVQDQIDALPTTYYKKTEIDGTVATLNENITKAKTTLTDHSTETAGVKVVKSANADGSDNYDITAVGLATKSALDAVDGRLQTVETNYIKTITADEASNVKVKATSGVANTWDFDFSEMVIDGGTY